MRFASNLIVAIFGLICAMLEPSYGAECNSQRAAHEIYDRILKNSLNQSSADDYFTIQSKLIALLASVHTPQSDRLLVKLENFYLGEASGEVLAEAITAKKSAILPILESELRQKSSCDSKQYRCSERETMIRHHIDMIKAGQVFQSDDQALKLYKKSDICRELSIIPSQISHKD